MTQNLSISNYLEAQRKEIRDNLEILLSNIYYTWNKDIYDFVDTLDGYNWRKTLPPTSIIHRYLEEEHIIEQDKDIKLINDSLIEFREYMDRETWFQVHSKEDPDLLVFQENPILYFSAEYGLVDWLQIYSGGLGVLAGDYVKQISDDGIPFVGIGFFYKQGYFHQDIDTEGMQREVYFPQEPASCLLRMLKDESGNPMEITVNIQGRDVFVRAWKLEVGRTTLYLLDTDYNKNNWEDRQITSHLYGGDNSTRIRQELILGVGGYRMAKEMGIKPSVFHLNEGHASFFLLEKMKEHMAGSGSIRETLDKAKQNVMFTNHTLNPAGNDKFGHDLLKEYLEPYASDLGVDFDKIFELGYDEDYSDGDFATTIFGLNGSKVSNAVSKLHGEAVKKVWPNFNMIAITNGVHMPTWVSKPIQELLDKYVDPNWRDPVVEPNWDKIRDIPDEDLWKIHHDLKKMMIDRLNYTLGTELKHDVLTIVWTRRFAAYKRPDIFLHDLERLKHLLYDSQNPVQFLIGGKAHPKDMIGKELLQRVAQIALDPEFKNKVTYMTAYNWNLARYLVAGTDIWLNNPIRFEEASGTSGMKAAANGVLQLTTLDGWTDEIDWYGKGWVLPQKDIHAKIYEIIENQVAPTYYEGKFSKTWVSMMKETMIVALRDYNMGRMLEEYVNVYKDLAKQNN